MENIKVISIYQVLASAHSKPWHKSPVMIISFKIEVQSTHPGRYYPTNSSTRVNPCQETASAATMFTGDNHAIPYRNQNGLTDIMTGKHSQIYANA